MRIFLWVMCENRMVVRHAIFFCKTFAVSVRVNRKYLVLL